MDSCIYISIINHIYIYIHNYTNLTEHKYFLKNFIKIVPIECFACAVHQGTQHLIQIGAILINIFFNICVL